MNSGQELRASFVVSGGDAADVLEPAKAALGAYSYSIYAATAGNALQRPSPEDAILRL